MSNIPRYDEVVFYRAKIAMRKLSVFDEYNMRKEALVGEVKTVGRGVRALIQNLKSAPVAKKIVAPAVTGPTTLPVPRKIPQLHTVVQQTERVAPQTVKKVAPPPIPKKSPPPIPAAKAVQKAEQVTSPPIPKKAPPPIPKNVQVEEALPPLPTSTAPVPQPAIVPRSALDSVQFPNSAAAPLPEYAYGPKLPRMKAPAKNVAMDYDNAIPAPLPPAAGNVAPPIPLAPAAVPSIPPASIAAAPTTAVPVEAAAAPVVQNAAKKSPGLMRSVLPYALIGGAGYGLAKGIPAAAETLEQSASLPYAYNGPQQYQYGFSPSGQTVY
jgi:hypothetical protein